MFYMDWTYIYMVLPALIFSLWASARVKNVFNKYNRITNSKGITGAQAADILLRANGINDVTISPIAGSLSDYYNPQTKEVRLSVYGSTSIAAIGVACHEIGHAIQHAEGYKPVKIRTAIVPITNFGARLSWPLIIIGFIICSMSYYSSIGILLLYSGIILFSFCVIFQLVTLPVEFDASKRALKGIKEIGLLDDEELDGASKVLRAAALTYLAALAVSVAQFLRILILFSGRRD